jgi:EmrB/QacA subfamily drug resistance transporter
MGLAQAMILLDVTIVNVALPSIQRGLRMSPGRLEWVVSAYALALAALIPLGGALGDRYGRKRCFLVGMVVFTAASAACAASTVDLELIAFRGLQGVGGALMSSLTLSILVEATPQSRRPAAIGTWAAMGGVGFMMGPIFGGLLLAEFSWSSVFWVNVPLGVVALALTAAGVAESRDPAARRLDPWGAVLATVALFLVTFGLVESADRSWGSAPVVGTIGAGVLLLATFLWWEHRSASPMVPPIMLRQRRFATGNLVLLLGFLALTGMFFFVTLYFQDLEGWSALRTGVSWLALGVPFLFVAQSSGRLTARYSPGLVVAAGCLFAASGIAGLSQLSAATPLAAVIVCYCAIAVGFGLLSPGASTAVMTSVQGAASGIASGILNTSRQLGTSVGLAVLGSVGVTVAVHGWNSAVSSGAAQVAPGHRSAALALGTQVAGGRADEVAERFGPAAGHQAAQAFEQGLEIALLTGAALLVVAAVAALALLRQATPAGATPPPIAPAAASRG